ncbi:sulfotransferase 1C2-like [Haemaphysalis longicornis]
MEQQRIEPEQYYQKVYWDIDGIPLCRVVKETNVRSVLSYNPADDDVFIVTYPKCGTMWMQHIVYGIITHGSKNLPTLDERRKTMPFLEWVGADVVSATARPRIIKSHLPLQLLPFSAKAKYIYVARNPYDVCVSNYYHKKVVPFYFFENGTFDEFVDMFVRGKVTYGDYFDHLLSWYRHRDDDNVMFVTYEELKRDTRGWILKIADFLGIEEYGRPLKEDPVALEKVFELSSFEQSKILYTRDDTSTDNTVGTNVCHDEASTSTGTGKNEDILKKVKQNHTRKGIVGDWKNHFSMEQVTNMRKYITLKTCGSDVMNLWKDVNIP